MFSSDYAMGKAKSDSGVGPIVRALLLIGLLWPLLAACGQSAQPPAINVVATIGPYADWAQRVGGDRVKVTQIVPASTDPRHYAPTDENKRAIAAADVILYNGLYLEPWLTSMIEQTASPRVVLLEMGQMDSYNPRAPSRPPSRVVPEPDSQSGSTGGSRSSTTSVEASSYIWLDPSSTRAQRGVMLIADTLARVDLDHLLYYRRNAEQYNGELENLDNWIKQQVRTWPRVTAGTRSLLAVQSLDRSWQPFMQRYGIHLRTSATLKMISPPLPDTTPLFIDRFTSQQTQLNSRSRQPSGVLDPLSGGDYITMLRTNVSIIAQGLNQALVNGAAQPVNLRDQGVTP